MAARPSKRRAGRHKGLRTQFLCGCPYRGRPTDPILQLPYASAPRARMPISALLTPSVIPHLLEQGIERLEISKSRNLALAAFSRSPLHLSLLPLTHSFQTPLHLSLLIQGTRCAPAPHCDKLDCAHDILFSSEVGGTRYTIISPWRYAR